MADRTLEALELALELVKCAEAADMFSPADDTPLPAKLRDIHDAIAGALSSLRQQPVQIGNAELAVRLHRAVRAAGSETALAAKMGIRRQSLSDVLSGRRAPVLQCSTICR
jgi:DNA-binding phage protein